MCHLSTVQFLLSIYIFHILSSWIVQLGQIKAQMLLNPKKNKKNKKRKKEANTLQAPCFYRNHFPFTHLRRLPLQLQQENISLLSLLQITSPEMLSDAFSKVQEAEHGEASLLKNHDLTQTLRKLKHVIVVGTKSTSQPLALFS